MWHVGGEERRGEERRGADRILVGKPEENRSFGRPWWCRLEYNIKMDFTDFIW
jgi:hypothetical protein